MGMPLQLKKNTILKRRFRWNQAARSPLPPVLMGLVTFSFVTVALGAAVYVAAVPGLVQQSPAVQTVATAVEESGLPEAISGALSNGGGFSEASVNATNSSGFSSVSPASSFNSPETGETSTETESNLSEQPDVAPPDSGTDDSQGSGEQENPGGIADSEEAQYHAAIVEAYNDLPAYEQKVNTIIQDFNNNCFNLSSDERYATFQRAASLVFDLSGGGYQLAQLAIPRESRWYEASQAVQNLYGNLYSTGAIYQRSWMLNVLLDDPQPYREQWMQPITEHLVDGQIDLLFDYQEQKPLVGAML